MNYIKYALKQNEELTELLNGKDKLFVVACNKCFKEFDVVTEPELEEFSKLAKELGKTITGSARVDFLCNRVQSEKVLEAKIPEGTENVIVISCGLGVQTMAEMEELPVYTATNSLNFIGSHGMALTKKTCDACNQCFLNMTGGICPVVDCTKSLLNGQCGGAKNGKCEIDPKKDCAWENIYQRLAAQGRLEEFLNEEVQLRDYSKVNFKAVNEYVKSVREKRYEGFYGGVHPEERKEFTEHMAPAVFPAPKQVVIPLSMHSGKPATPLVVAGDEVKLGQKIGEIAGFISANVHSSVSGKVVAVEERLHPNRGMVMSVVIENDGKDTLADTVKPNKPLEELTPAEITEIVKEAGITGMGGAGFPTYVKLQPGKPIDAVILNGSECEPLITADHRALLAYPDEIIFGLKAIMKAVDAPKGVILIEDNKQDAVELFQAKVEGEENIEICVAKTQYPEGAEKMIIKKVLKRSVPSGGLPADAGAVVSNVSTAKAIADAIQKGLPLTERIVTVSGEKIAKPGNYIVKVGTSIKEIIDYCGGLTDADVTVKMGGAMMGSVLADGYDVPVIKAANGIIAVPNEAAAEQMCIKCGRCMDVCPMELKPLYFQKYLAENNVQGLLDMSIKDCMECGCCQYICSSKIPLVERIRMGKKAIMEVK